MGINNAITNTKEERFVKRTIKDTVFSDFFGIPENLLKLYQTLHPEDDVTAVGDLKIVTIKNVLVNDIYNDLGFSVGNKLLILVEAQTTWSINIIIRVLIYLANTYQEYIDSSELDIYSSTRIKIPKPELFVLYTGDRIERLEELSLSDEFFDGESDQLDLKVKVLYGTNKDDVISQYVTFTKVYDEQRKLYGRTRDSIINTIRVCKDHNIMKEYFESREKEVISMFMTLYDDETISRNHDAQLKRETKKETTEDILSMLLAKGAITQEQAEEVRKTVN